MPSPRVPLTYADKNTLICDPPVVVLINDLLHVFTNVVEIVNLYQSIKRHFKK